MYLCAIYFKFSIWKRNDLPVCFNEKDVFLGYTTALSNINCYWDVFQVKTWLCFVYPLMCYLCVDSVHCIQVWLYHYQYHYKQKALFLRQNFVQKKGYCIFWSERSDLNWRPLPPQGSALPSCATSRWVIRDSVLSLHRGFDLWWYRRDDRRLFPHHLVVQIHRLI